MNAIRLMMVASPIVLAAWAMSYAGGVVVETSSGIYDPGDTVYFTISNETGYEIYFPKFPIYAVLDSAGYEVYPQNHIPTFEYWDPGYSEDYAWGQNYSGGPYVPEGVYYIETEWRRASAPQSGGVAADTFWIYDRSSVDPPLPATWGRMKALYR
jgi:hypothetical protein